MSSIISPLNPYYDHVINNICEKLFATPPITANITIYLHPTIVGQKTAGGNTILDVTFAGDIFTGTFTGTGSGIARAIIHKGSINVRYIETFTGTMDGKSGTIVFSLIGEGPGIGLPVKGRWVILSGTGDFATIHGEGTVGGIAGGFNTLMGYIHFDP